MSIYSDAALKMAIYIYRRLRVINWKEKMEELLIKNNLKKGRKIYNDIYF